MQKTPWQWVKQFVAACVLLLLGGLFVGGCVGGCMIAAFRQGMDEAEKMQREFDAERKKESEKTPPKKTGAQPMSQKPRGEEAPREVVVRVVVEPPPQTGRSPGVVGRGAQTPGRRQRVVLDESTPPEVVRWVLRSEWDAQTPCSAHPGCMRRSVDRPGLYASVHVPGVETPRR